MRAQIYLRPYDENRPGEKKLLVEWLYANREKNRFDPEIFTKKQVKVYTLWSEEEGIIGFIPVGVIFLVESLAFKPGLEPIIEARALQTFQHWLVFKAFEQNVSDAVFVTTDETVIAFAERHGWKEPVVPQLVLHFAELEKKPEEGKTP